MNKKSLIKYAHGDERGLMHYVIFEGDVVVLSEYETKKVEYINQHGELSVTFDIDSKEYEDIKVEVSNNKEMVSKVYNYMLETNNAYFKDGTEGLCVIKVSVK